MQRIQNLVDLEKCCKMILWSQKSVSIQKITSLLKFDDLAEKSEKDSISNLSPICQPNHQTLKGSFSSVSTATIARVGSFFSIFRDLQDLHSFAPLESQMEKTWKNHPENDPKEIGEKRKRRNKRNCGKIKSIQNDNQAGAPKKMQVSDNKRT